MVWFNLIIFSAFSGLLMKWKSFISILLTLEVVIVSILFFFSLVLGASNLNLLFFLFIGVLEAIMGLSLLIFLLRFNKMGLMKFL